MYKDFKLKFITLSINYELALNFTVNVGNNSGLEGQFTDDDSSLFYSYYFNYTFTLNRIDMASR